MIFNIFNIDIQTFISNLTVLSLLLQFSTQALDITDFFTKMFVTITDSEGPELGPV